VAFATISPLQLAVIVTSLDNIFLLDLTSDLYHSPHRGGAAYEDTKAS
jgi:hypothetical protein